MNKFTKSTSGRVHYEVHKQTILLRSPQVDEFITRSLSGRIHYEVHISGQIHYQVHKWTSLILSPQKGRVQSNK